MKEILDWLNFEELEYYQRVKPFITTELLIFTATVILYLMYRSYFYKMELKADYKYDQKLKYKGKPLPSFPNGWYVALHSFELKKGDAVAIDLAGENMVAFRSSETGEAFILEAYCKHLGAHLGIGGKVVNKKCVQCPFHGWLYDGETGICVDHNNEPIVATNC